MFLQLWTVLYLHIDASVIRVERQPGGVGFVVEACVHVTTPLHWRPLRVLTGTLQGGGDRKHLSFYYEA